MARILRKVVQLKEIEVNPDAPFSIMGWDLVALHNSPGYKVAEVQEKLKEFGLPKEAKEIRSRNAILRALREAERGAKDLVVLVENDKQIIFQLTSISKEDDEKYGKIAKYIADAHIKFDKASCEIECENAKLRAYLMDRFVLAQEHYRTHDVTRILLRIFERSGDVLPLRKKGGAYIVPSTHQEFAEAARQFIKALNPMNTVSLFPVKVSKEAKKDVKELMLDQKTEELRKFREELKALEEEDKTRREDDRPLVSERPSVRKHRKIRLAAIKKKIALWSRVLDSEVEELNELMVKCEKTMAKVFAA